MRKTFKEILKEEFNSEENYAITSGDIDEIEIFCIKLMQLVRTQTLKEVADVAEADYNWINDVTDIEVYVLKESILQLDKNSIQL